MFLGDGSVFRLLFLVITMLTWCPKGTYAMENVAKGVA
jgi:hypothetical protein